MKKSELILIPIAILVELTLIYFLVFGDYCRYEGEQGWRDFRNGVSSKEGFQIWKDKKREDSIERLG